MDRNRSPGSPPPRPRAPKSPMAGGALLALSLIVGVVVGTMQGQPSVGFVAGLGIGLLLIALVWAIDTRRAD